MSKRTEADRKYFLTSVTHEHVHETVLNVFGFHFLQLNWDVAPKIEHGRKLADVLRVIMWLHDGERLHGLDLNLRDLFLCFPHMVLSVVICSRALFDICSIRSAFFSFSLHCCTFCLPRISWHKTIHEDNAGGKRAAAAVVTAQREEGGVAV